MPIETIASRAETPAAPFPLPAVLPSPLRHAVASPSPELRLRVARDLDLRLRGLEQEIRKLGESFTSARQATRDHLQELQQRCTSLTTELLRAGARLVQQSRAQQEGQRQLEQNLHNGLNKMEQGMTPMAAELNSLANHQRSLQRDLESTRDEHENLERIVNRLGRNLDIIAAEFQQRLEIMCAALERLNEDAKAREQALLALSQEQDQLALAAQRLREETVSLRQDFVTQREQIRRHTLFVALLLGALAITTGLTVWQLSILLR